MLRLTKSRKESKMDFKIVEIWDADYNELRAACCERISNTEEIPLLKFGQGTFQKDIFPSDLNSLFQVLNLV